MNTNQLDIIQTGIRSLSVIDYSISQIFSLVPDPNIFLGPPYRLISDSKIPTALYMLCSAQSEAYGCLFDNGNRRSTEKKLHYELRLERISEVKRIMEGVDTPHLRNKEIRNALAHFAERYLQSMIEKPKYSIVKDVGLSHEGIILPPPGGELIHIRTYTYSTDMFRLFNETLRLNPLRLEHDAVCGKFGLQLAR